MSYVTTGLLHDSLHKQVNVTEASGSAVSLQCYVTVTFMTSDK